MAFYEESVDPYREDGKGDEAYEDYFASDAAGYREDDRDGYRDDDRLYREQEPYSYEETDDRYREAYSRMSEAPAYREPDREDDRPTYPYTRPNERTSYSEDYDEPYQSKSPYYDDRDSDDRNYRESYHDPDDRHYRESYSDPDDRHYREKAGRQPYYPPVEASESKAPSSGGQSGSYGGGSKHGKCCPLVVDPKALMTLLTAIAGVTFFLNQQILAEIMKRKRRSFQRNSGKQGLSKTVEKVFLDVRTGKMGEWETQ